MDQATAEIVARNLQSVRRRMAQACVRAGRQPAEVTLVAVTKSVPVDVIHILYELGERDFGESRPQSISISVAAA